MGDDVRSQGARDRMDSGKQGQLPDKCCSEANFYWYLHKNLQTPPDELLKACESCIHSFPAGLAASPYML